MTVNRPRVVIASRLFPPEPGAAAYRLGALARTLVSRGVSVRVLSTRPPGGLRPQDAPGVRVSRWPVRRDAGGNVRGYLSFASFDGPLAARLLLTRGVDLVVVEPPPTTGAVVRVVAALRRRRYVYYAGDVSSAAAQAIGLRGPLLSVLRRLEAWAMSGAVCVLTVSDSVAEAIADLTGARVRVVVVGTGVDTGVFRPQPDAPATAAPTFVYAGTMSEVHGAAVFVEAFGLVRAEHPQARLVMFGQGTDLALMRRRADELALGAVEFPGVVPGAVVAAAFSGAVAGLASLRPGAGYDIAFPTKMFAATACGAPVVYAGGGPGRTMVEEHGLGWGCDWEPQAVAEGMRSALAAPPTPQRRAGLAAWTEENASQRSVAGRAADAVLEAADQNLYNRRS